jgi:hypothetical protein
MWYKILLFTSICVFASCAKNKMLLTEQHNNYAVKLIIQTAKDTVFDSINVTVFLKNNTGNDIYLLKTSVIGGKVVFIDNPSSWWKLNILFQDTIQMIPYPFIRVRMRHPRKEDYFLLKSEEIYTFNFDVDFTKLAREPLEFGSINNNYGVYSVKLVYTDPFLVEKKAFRGKIESNVIRLMYKKQ